MGIYINPGNEAFAEIADHDYVDKTMLIDLINHTVERKNKLTCISRPRRFGKSYAAKMLTAYYDLSCDSHLLFKGRKIEATDTYAKYLNAYNVIYLDITTFTSDLQSKDHTLRDIPGLIQSALLVDLQESGFKVDLNDSLNNNLLNIVDRQKGKKFIFIIDEWDGVIREAKGDKDAQKRYLNLLRGWFKNGNFTPKVVAAAYMTGILPIKKDGSQSAMSDFNEYSVLEPVAYAEFFGFTDDEVRAIFENSELDYEDAKLWYNGYTIGPEHSMYNPFSVMKAASLKKFTSYWKQTSVTEALITYIDMDQEGLQSDIAALITGQSIEVDTSSFNNDFDSFTCKDDVLTLLIHLGYLTYEEEDNTGYARIPNEEIRQEFDKILRRAKHKTLIELIKRSDRLLEDTLAGNEKEVARAIQEVHETSFAPTLYNNEQALRYTVKMAYISCVDQYAKVEEMPTGHGVADTLFIPKRRSPLPAMIIELKWNLTAVGALEQIRDRNYEFVPAQIGGDVLLVGINYDAKSKEHSCRIEKIHIPG